MNVLKAGVKLTTEKNELFGRFDSALYKVINSTRLTLTDASLRHPELMYLRSRVLIALTHVGGTPL